MINSRTTLSGQGVKASTKKVTKGSRVKGLEEAGHEVALGMGVKPSLARVKAVKSGEIFDAYKLVALP